MEKNRMDILKEILDGNSQRLRETFFINNHNELYKIIINHIDLDIQFKEKLWYWANYITEDILCKSCKINKTTFNKNWYHGYRDFCSTKCSLSSKQTKDKRSATNLERYGVENVAQSPEIKKKIESVNMERYGTKSSFQNEEVRTKWSRNIKEKYGVDHIFQLDSVKDKIKQTINNRYGVEYYTQSDDYKNLYKDEDFSSNFKDKIKKGDVSRKETCLEKYGIEYYLQSDDAITKRKENDQNIKDSYLKQSVLKYSDENYTLINRVSQIFTFIDIKNDDIFDIHYDTYKQRINRGVELNTNIKPLFDTIGANINELEIYGFLDSLEVEYVKNDRSLLCGKELDVYLPDYDLALEHNGLYWHSELKIDNKNYHLDKTERCKEKGIDLLHIFEDDWIDKRDIIESIIRNKLNKIETKIFARKCVVKCVESNIVREFLDTNHIQGFSKSSYKLGLYYNDDLVSLMTFGYRKTNSKKEFELIRFCNKLNVSVIGAASKLFKHFIKNYSDKIESNYILSYADVSMFNGSLYNTLGFDYIHRTAPNYFWVINRKKVHRWKYNKQKLIAEGFESSKTEVEIMHERGYYRIYGCGQDRYEYKL